MNRSAWAKCSRCVIAPNPPVPPASLPCRPANPRCQWAPATVCRPAAECRPRIVKDYWSHPCEICLEHTVLNVLKTELPNLTNDWSAPPWAHTNSSFVHLPGVVILELGEAQVTERRTQSPMRACGSRSRRRTTDGHDTGWTRRHFLEKALLKRGPQSSRRVESYNGKGDPMSSPRFRAASARWVASWIRASGPVIGCLGLSWRPACALPPVTCFHDCCLPSTTAVCISSETTVTTIRR